MRLPPTLLVTITLLSCAAAAPALGASGAMASNTPSIAILDSGILPTHPEFTAGQVVAWCDFVNGEPAPYDDLGHGTAAASRAAGATLGVSPGAPLIVAKVLNDRNVATWRDVADSIRWATDEGADVISVSLWSDVPHPRSSLTALGPAINYASERGVLVVWMAGNGGRTDIGTPAGRLSGPAPTIAPLLPGASSPQALVVGAADANGTVAPWSQRAPEALAAGVRVPVASMSGGVRHATGTSFSTPWVAGVAAMLLANGAPKDPDWLEWVILHSADDDPSISYAEEGYGFLGGDQVSAAVSVARGEKPPPPPDARDAFHAGTTVIQTGQTAQPPGGIMLGAKTPG